MNFSEEKAKFDVIMNRIKSYKIKNSSNKKINLKSATTRLI